MATLTLTVGASANDAAVDDIFGGYDDTSDFIYWGQPGTSPPANYGQGIRLTGVALASSDTVNSAQVKLMKDTDEWTNVNWRLTAIDQDNTAVFSSGSEPGSRPVVSASIAAETLNISHTDGVVYTFPSTGTLQNTLGAAIEAVTNRAGWSSGNALGIVCQSDQDAGSSTGFQREAFYTFDSAVSSSEPQLVIDYTAGAGGGGAVAPPPMRMLRGAGL